MRVQMLKDHEQWFKILLESMEDAVIVTDDHYRIHYMNPLAASFTSRNPEIICGQVFNTVFDIVDEKTGKPLKEGFQEVIHLACKLENMGKSSQLNDAINVFKELEQEMEHVYAFYSKSEWEKNDSLSIMNWRDKLEKR